MTYIQDSRYLTPPIPYLTPEPEPATQDDIEEWKKACSCIDCPSHVNLRCKMKFLKDMGHQNFGKLMDVEYFFNTISKKSEEKSDDGFRNGNIEEAPIDSLDNDYQFQMRTFPRIKPSMP